MLAEPLHVHDALMRIDGRFQCVRREPRLALGFLLRGCRFTFRFTLRWRFAFHRFRRRRPRVRCLRIPAKDPYPPVQAPGQQPIFAILAPSSAQQTRHALGVAQHLKLRPVSCRVQHADHVGHGPEVRADGEDHAWGFSARVCIVRVHGAYGVDAPAGAAREGPDALPRAVVLRQHALTLRSRQS